MQNAHENKIVYLAHKDQSQYIVWPQRQVSTECITNEEDCSRTPDTNEDK